MDGIGETVRDAPGEGRIISVSRLGEVGVNPLGIGVHAEKIARTISQTKWSKYLLPIWRLISLICFARK